MAIVIVPVHAIIEKHNQTSTNYPLYVKGDGIIHVAIIDYASVSSEKLAAIENAVISTDTVTKDDQTLYLGWQGALEKASNYDTTFKMPKKLVIDNSWRGLNIVTIILRNDKNEFGYSGTTEFSTLDKKIMDPKITIYDVGSRDSKQLGSIVRHEFGHALGLAHSMSDGNLMNNNAIQRDSYISDCNIEALVYLYDGHFLSVHKENSYGMN